MKKGQTIILPGLRDSIKTEDILEISPTENVAIITSSKKIKSEGLTFNGKKYHPSDLIWMGINKIGIIYDSSVN
jgi:hypothetical protein